MKKKLIEQLRKLQEKQQQINKQLDALSYKKRLNGVMRLKGKCYKEIQNMNKDCVTCVYLFGVETELCRLLSLFVSYCNNVEDYFDISTQSMFNPEEDNEKWEEISFEEYLKHYQIAVKKMRGVFTQK